jgi:predicted TIM-barrel fold metal-dependent hydrolase
MGIGERPSADRRSSLIPKLKIIMAHPVWPWVDKTTAVALHKGNVYWEMSGWAPKYLPGTHHARMGRARLFR